MLNVEIFCNEAVHNVCFAAGVPMPSFILGEEHVRAGAVPVHTRFGPDWPGPRSGGAAQNPRLPGPVPSGLPLRAEPHALRWNEGGHGPNWDLDIKDVPPLPATYASELFLQWSIWIGVVIECVILDLREFAFHEELRGSFMSVLWYFMKYGIWRTKRQTHPRTTFMTALWLRSSCGDEKQAQELWVFGNQTQLWTFGLLEKLTRTARSSKRPGRGGRRRSGSDSREYSTQVIVKRRDGGAFDLLSLFLYIREVY